MEIIKYPNTILATPSVDVKITPEIKKLAEEMFATMKALPWGRPVGLAAPQVGFNYNMFWANDVLYINPKITYLSPEKTVLKEGCYSLQREKYFNVSRHNELILEWTDKKGKPHRAKFHGFNAQVIQHEYDHLLGKLCNK
jgi:peptide deformylase